MSHILHRHTASVPPVAVGGDGPYVLAADGSRYLDAYHTGRGYSNGDASRAADAHLGWHAAASVPV